MPFNSIENTVPTITEFVNHWTLVNAALAPNPLILPGGYTLANLQTALTTITGLQTDVITTDNTRQIAASDRDQQKALLRERIRQFRASVQGLLGGSVFVKALPKQPGTNAKEQDFLRALDDMKSLWTNINASPPAGFTGPLALSNTYLIASFTAHVALLRTAYTATSQADTAATFARKNRDAAIAVVKEKMVMYRQAVAGSFTAGHPLIVSLPAVSPPAGSTPPAVSLSGSWNVGDSLANLVWSASSSPSLDHYSIRYHPGPTYKASEEQSVTTVAAGTELLDTAYGLPASGSVAWFKVYVVTSTGNEKGSNAVKITRP